jgi:feruloyl esterase
MMFTQRFPSYFDGVIAMAPAMRVSKGATIAAAWDTQALGAIAPAGTDGKPVLARALSDGDLALVRTAILKSCDAQDGLADGLVSHPAACRFDVRSLACSGAKNADCLAPAQVGALQKMFGGPADSAGASSISAGPGIRAWAIRPTTGACGSWATRRPPCPTRATSS